MKFYIVVDDDLYGLIEVTKSKEKCIEAFNKNWGSRVFIYDTDDDNYGEIDPEEYFEEDDD